MLQCWFQNPQEKKKSNIATKAGSTEFYRKAFIFQMWKVFQNLVTQEATEQTKQSADRMPQMNCVFVPTLLEVLQGSLWLYHFVFKDCRSVWFLKESTELIV